ncbi:uncharacterized protein ACLA_053950 [Aspergillus clavatus NRRL 1]|uniref:Uncharacterized protein n=1 Tax=Aspergillus clavatus (strain ATCC 1007 / CBS 513.65 / DSM 816 / NCTC 3887 / NRRL 1 / QM 1276 / 107) TaxID=344612 RepID=A1C925_ASPCL|nr:uncharacterized protein ACLA_053950 [Aspergillus clavatus NRRL 1]EAW13349.1 hypothetical protein ACLA_053950 [Aspergillus clavatus NRRL 1]
MDPAYKVLPESTEKVQGPIWELATLTTTDDLHNLWAEDFQLLELDMLSMSLTSTMAGHDRTSSQEECLLADEDQSLASSEEVFHRASSSADSYVTTAERNVDLDPVPVNTPQPSATAPESKKSCPLIRSDFVGLVKRLCKGFLPRKE